MTRLHKARLEGPMIDNDHRQMLNTKDSRKDRRLGCLIESAGGLVENQ